MTEKERIEWLLELQEHPEQLTDEQVRHILADDEMLQLVQQLGFAKRAFKNKEAKGHTPDVDGEWEKFAAEYAGKLDALDKGMHHKSIVSILHSPLRKLAASFVAAIIASGLALAAIHIVQQHQRQHIPQITDTTAVASKLKPQTSNLKPKHNAIPATPLTFDNVPLDEMLQEIASFHHADVEFENETARSLRFHFVWKRVDSLATVVEKLNTFDAVNVTIDNNKLIVR